jgi:hypothetical protein
MVMTMASCPEIWKDVPGYGGRLQASSLGRLRVVVSYTRILKPYVNRDGYHIGTLCIDGGKVRHGVHRFVAEAFLPNPDGKEQVNHIDGDKSNNRPENLEWSSCQENNLHRCRVLGAKCGREKRPIVCLSTGEWFPSMTAASQAAGVPVHYIIKVCKHQRDSTMGLRFAYAEEVPF